MLSALHTGLSVPLILGPRREEGNPLEFAHQIPGRQRLLSLNHQIILKLLGLGVNPGQNDYPF